MLNTFEHLAADGRYYVATVGTAPSSPRRTQEGKADHNGREMAVKVDVYHIHQIAAGPISSAVILGAYRPRNEAELLALFGESVHEAGAYRATPKCLEGFQPAEDDEPGPRWYAVMRELDDTDASYGDYSEEWAIARAREYRAEGYEEAFVAVYVDDRDPYCVDEIHDLD